MGLLQTGRSVDGTTASSRGVPRSAPRSNSRLGGSNTPLNHILIECIFFMRFFCSSQLASPNLVPRVPWDAREELIVIFISLWSQKHHFLPTPARTQERPRVRGSGASRGVLDDRWRLAGLPGSATQSCTECGSLCFAS